MMELNSKLYWIMVFLSILGSIHILFSLKNIVSLIFHSIYNKIKGTTILLMDIESCPICGCPSISIYKNYLSEDPEDEDAVGYVCKCDYCGLTTPMLKEKKDVLNYWNTRNGKLMHEWKEGQ